MKLIDSHAHLLSEDFDKDRDFLIKDLQNFGIDYVIVPSTNLENLENVVRLSQKYDNIYAKVGFNASDKEKNKDGDIERLRELAKDENVLAIGEIGLDYYWKDDNKDEQKELFKKQLDLAKELELPVAIHTRDSIDDALDILK